MISTNFNTKRSLRSFKSMFGVTNGTTSQAATMNFSSAVDWETQSSSNALNSLHLPPSLSSLDRMSPKLWKWVHSSDFGRQEQQASHAYYNGDSSALRQQNAYYLTRVFSPAGELLDIPAHLIEIDGSTDANDSANNDEHDAIFGFNKLLIQRGNDDSYTDLKMNKSQPAHSGLTRSATMVSRGAPGNTIKRRKPVSTGVTSHLDLPVPENPKIKRFFLKFTDVHLKQIPAGDCVIGVVSVGSQKHCTSILPLARDQVTSPKGFNITSHPGEGFLFDIPEASGDFTVAIRLYSKNSMVQHGFSSDTTSSMGLSQSIESFSHGFSSLSSTNLSSSKYSLFNTKLRPGSSSSTTLNNQALEYDGLRTPAPPNSLGTCLGEMSFSLPTNHPFGKVSGTYTIVHAGKKETGKIVLQMGLFLDEEFHLPPEIPPGPTNHQDFLNFMLRMPQGSAYWKKYYVVVSTEAIQIYDPEYQQTRPPIAVIPTNQLLYVSMPNIEYMAAPKAIELHMNPSFFQQDGQTPIAQSWLNALQLAGTASYTNQIGLHNDTSIYALCDSNEALEGWNAFLNRPKPALPKRRKFI